MRSQLYMPPEHLVDTAMAPSAVSSCRSKLSGSAILIRDFRPDPGRQDTRQLARIAGPKLVEASRAVVVEAAQKEDEFFSDFNIWAAEISEGPRQTLSAHSSAGKADCATLSNVARSAFSKVMIDRKKSTCSVSVATKKISKVSLPTVHRYLPNRRLTERQMENCDLNPIKARSVCPRHARSESNRSVDYGIVLG